MEGEGRWVEWVLGLKEYLGGTSQPPLQPLAVGWVCMGAEEGSSPPERE